MGVNTREFYVHPGRCTECGNCIKTLPKAFRKVKGQEIAEVHETAIDDSLLPRLEYQMAECPGNAILWRGGRGRADRGG